MGGAAIAVRGYGTPATVGSLFPMAMLPVDAMLLTLLELFMLPRGKQRLMLMLSTGLMDTEVMDMEDTPLLDTEVLDTQGHMDSAMDTLTMVKPEYLVIFLSLNNFKNKQAFT